MDMPEQEIIRQSLGDTIKGVRNEIEVIQSADCDLASKTGAVNLKGDSSCERPAAKIMPGEFSETRQRPILVGNRQKLLDHRAAYVQAQGSFPLRNSACRAPAIPEYIIIEHIISQRID